MLVIREAQFRAFEEAARRSFENQAVRYLEERLPEEARELGSEALRSFVSEVTARARAYGLQTQRDLLHFLRLTLRHGRDFENRPEYPDAAEILSDPDYQPSVKLQIVAQIARRREKP